MPPPDLVKKRVRAALELSDYSNVEQLAEALNARDSGIGLKRLRTIWQKGESRAVERREIAEACGVPLSFMEHGFAATGEEEIRLLVKSLRDDLTDLATTVAQQAAELRGLRDRDHQTGSREGGGR